MSVHALALVLLGLSRRLGREEGGVGAEGIEPGSAECEPVWPSGKALGW